MGGLSDVYEKVKTIFNALYPLFVVRNLGVYVDAEVTMRAHVTATVRAALQYCGRLAAFDILCHVQPC